jgi:hypothetical protein
VIEIAVQLRLIVDWLIEGIGCRIVAAKHGSHFPRKSSCDSLLDSLSAREIPEILTTSGRRSFFG